MTQVLDLNKGVYIQYTLSPVAAVIAAHQQYDKGNWNTWTYPTSLRELTIRSAATRIQGEPREVSIVSCGNFSCMCPLGRELDYVPQDYEAKA